MSSKHERYKSNLSRHHSYDKDEKTLKQLTESLQRMKEKKQLLKATETPEEKRARRLAKKEAKERKKKKDMGWDDEYAGYTNQDNPFGDDRLCNVFVWKKKLLQEGYTEEQMEDYEKEQKGKRLENRQELERVKKRRLDREREQAERETERELMQRQKESEYFSKWSKQEDTFHLQQAKLRSKIRITDGRAKPVDLLAQYIGENCDEDISVEIYEPYKYLDGLTRNDLEDLLEDIKVYQELHRNNSDYQQFWVDITSIAKNELEKLIRLQSSSEFKDRRDGINKAVSKDVTSVFKDRTVTQLEMLKKEIENKLNGGKGVDIGFYETLLSQLHVHIAMARLKERHKFVLQNRLMVLQKQQEIDIEPLFPSTSKSSSENVSTFSELESFDRESSSPSAQKKPLKEDTVNEVKDDTTTDDQAYESYNSGNYSPRLLQSEDLDIDTIIYDPNDDQKKLNYQREQVLQTGQTKLDSESEFLAQAKKGMGGDEATFAVEAPIEQQQFLWSDKYRPRKPRFFNRVHTGFEWNKYNQTHYDVDNPPPKIVQGYKFNIFYPDLIDKEKPPTFTLTPVDDSPDFAILRFVAGPPYEDIAFKVVNREWETGYRRGFRCQFHNGIFQLWFHYKKYRYRR